MMLKAGVKPKPGAISRLVLALDRDPHLAGVTGALDVAQYSWWNVWHALQRFEF